MPRETVKQYALTVCICLFVLVYSIRGKKRVRHTESACRCFHIFFVTFQLHLFSLWVLLQPLVMIFKDEHLLT